MRKLTLEEFIEKARVIHGDKYDYSEVDYQSNKVKVKIICQKCGHIFWQIPNSHLLGKGCPKCIGKEKLTIKTFINRANILHNYKYDYSKSIYINYITDLNIICPIHGIFKQNPKVHLRGSGCPDCAKSISCSKGEIEMYEYIKSIYSGTILKNTRKYIGSLELDVYLLELKLAFEYNGEHWHQIHEERTPGYHENKRQSCKDKGIRLVEVWEKEWKKNKEKIKKEILSEIKKAESLV